MNFYKHYSFDLWMTLIKSNPSFKTERAQFFFKNFNSKKKTIAEIISIFRQVDLMCNAINEKTGKNIDSDEMHLMVISMMNDFDIASFANIDLCWLYNEMEALLFNYMPVVYSDQTLHSLDKLRQGSSCSFNISSNTAFVRGKALRKVLTSLSLEPFFDFQLYSDEIGISKPNRRFFELMLEGARGIPSNKNIALMDILHVGDNPTADIAGALSAGIHSFQINSNEATIKNLLN
ncbi:MAG: dehalogenase [Ferruginibacter sp.]|nr:dehalogenase [Ferruginibacter sp.]